MTGQLRHTLLQVRNEKKRADDLLEVVIPIGVALSSEKNFNRLLENVLLEAKSFCQADAGTLYLRTDDNQLKHVIVRNDTQQVALGGTTRNTIPFPPLPLYDPASGAPNERSVAAYVALHGRSVNIPNAYQSPNFDIDCPKDFDEETGYPSLLTIPLTNSAGQVVGVLELLNAQDPQTNRIIAFDSNLQQMMESFSSLAVAAIEAYIREQSLRQEIKQLRIEIDEVKRQQQVKEIVETDFFQDLRSKAHAMRNRTRGSAEPPPSAPPTDENLTIAQTDRGNPSEEP
jgi:GAF domain-containing protein